MIRVLRSETVYNKGSFHITFWQDNLLLVSVWGYLVYIPATSSFWIKDERSNELIAKIQYDNLITKWEE